ncbi:MAG TPA: helix-turn-helix domain-containing protein [Candidatus Limnocylindrales bacterium]|nr:helix-turn-helix domain-containing protein [Candidatus Limnocylindrales bacterium]
MAATAARNVITVVLPSMDDVLAAIPAGLVSDEPDLRARLRLALLNTQVSADADDLEAAIEVLRARAAGESSGDPFGKRIPAESFEQLADTADRALAHGRLDLPMVLALQYASGSIAAARGQRLLLFLSLNAAVRRVVWALSAAEVERLGLGHDRTVELGRWLLLWTEMSSMAVGEGYRATELEIMARDAAARRAAIDELLGSMATDARSAARRRRLAMRYGLDPDATYRVAAVMPGPELDPTPEVPGIDDVDLEPMAGRIDHLLRRPTGRSNGAARGIRIPFAITWRGAIVAVLAPDPREWQRLQKAIGTVFGASTASWTAIAVRAEGVPAIAHTLAELHEGLRVADDIGRRGVVDDLAELGIERLLLSDPALAAVIVERELGALLADPRMGDELVETLQVFFDAGENRRETARRLHLADRTVAYRLERAENLLGHGLDGEAGRRLNVALTLRRLEAARQGR